MTPRRTLLPAILATFTLALAGCTDPGPLKTRDPAATTAPGTAAPSDPAEGAPTELAAFYEQELEWGECGPDLTCTEVEVPLDYGDPAGETIRIAVSRMDTAGEGAPALFLNPGGPGGSGTAMLEWITFSISGAVLEEYNLVGFDPRGVNLSTAVDCISDAELDDWRSAAVDTATLEGLQEYSAEMEEFGENCAANTGELLGHVDTDSVARDLDILRAAVGQSETLDYLGYSYGTFLGAVYADLFPERVGRFVLDGAVDPALSISGLALGQAAGCEAARRAYLEDCIGSEVPPSAELSTTAGPPAPAPRPRGVTPP